MNISKIRSRLLELIQSQSISPRKLSELSGVPYSTLTYILNGSTPNPSIQAAINLAKSLSVSTDYLFGLDDDPTPKSLRPLPRSPSAKIPLLDWHNPLTWAKSTKSRPPVTQYVASEKAPSPDTFAIQITTSTHLPLFPKDSILIITPLPKYSPGDHLLAHVGQKIPALRILKEDAGKLFLTSLHINIPSEKLTPPNSILGKIIEVKIPL